MGRGISDLQKTILRIALANRTAEANEPPKGSLGAPWGERYRCDVSRVEVLMGHWGWKPVRWMRNDIRPHPSGLYFSREVIGADRYDSARASLPRAFRRLVDRGLATHRSYGINLTATGVESARKLSATEGKSFPNLTHSEALLIG